jgi:ABC-type Fe3+ transport system substrate-binding protein
MAIGASAALQKGGGRMTAKGWMTRREALAGLALAAAGGPALAQEPPADLIAQAKKEGSLTYYTDLIVDQVVRPLVSGFQAKYGITVEYSRADSQDTILRLTNEKRAGKISADMFSMTTGLPELVAAGVTRPITIDASALLPGFIDPKRQWVSANYYVLTPAANTDLVSNADLPKTYEDLLNPKWKGKMIWKPNDTSGAPGFIGNVLAFMGDDKGMDYLRRLKTQNVKSIVASARAILDQVIAGQFPIALQIFNHHAAISAKQGAPVVWLKIQPASVVTDVVGLVGGSPHPHAADLFVAYMISEAGQKVFQAADYFPARADVPPLMPELAPSTGHFKADVLTPEDVDKNYRHWNDIYNQLFA